MTTITNHKKKCNKMLCVMSALELALIGFDLLCYMLLLDHKQENKATNVLFQFLHFQHF